MLKLWTSRFHWQFLALAIYSLAAWLILSFSAARLPALHFSIDGIVVAILLGVIVGVLSSSCFVNDEAPSMEKQNIFLELGTALVLGSGEETFLRGAVYPAIADFSVFVALAVTMFASGILSWRGREAKMWSLWKFFESALLCLCIQHHIGLWLLACYRTSSEFFARQQHCQRWASRQHVFIAKLSRKVAGRLRSVRQSSKY